MRARQSAGEPLMPFDRFATVVKAQLAKLGGGASDVSFRVNVSQGKVTLMAKKVMNNESAGVRSAECEVCEVRSAECGVRSAECEVRSAECGVRSAKCGVRSASARVRGLWSGPGAGGSRRRARSSGQIRTTLPA